MNQDKVPCDLPKRSNYATLLNNLSDMQGSFLYAARRDVLHNAEAVIFTLEHRVKKLESERIELEAQNAIAWNRADNLDADVAKLKDERVEIVKVALKSCATACDDKHFDWRFGDGDDSTSGPKECADAIRSLDPLEILRGME